jgi:hypothetical protein
MKMTVFWDVAPCRFLMMEKLSSSEPLLKFNPTYPRRGGVNALGRRTGLWSTEAKARHRAEGCVPQRWR